MAGGYVTQAAAVGLAVIAVWILWMILRLVATRPPQPARWPSETVIRLRAQIETSGRIPLAPPGGTQLPLALRPGEVVLLRTPCRTRRGAWGPPVPHTGELILTNRRVLFTGRGKLLGLRLQEARLLDWGLSEIILSGSSRTGRSLHFYTADAPAIRELLVALRAREWSVGESCLALVR